MVLLPNVVVCCDISLPSLGFGLLLMDKSSGEAGHGYGAPAVTRHHSTTHAGSLQPQTLVGTPTLRCREADKGWHFHPASTLLMPVFRYHGCLCLAATDAHTPLPWMPILCYHGCLYPATTDAHTLLPWMPVFRYHGCPYSATTDAHILLPWMPIFRATMDACNSCSRRRR